MTASTIVLTVHGSVTDSEGLTIPVGDDDVRLTVTLGTGSTYMKTIEVAQNTTKTLFDATNDLTEFDMAFVLSDQDVYLEITIDANNGVGDEYIAIKIPADRWFILPSNVGYANYTVNFGGGTLDVIDRLRVRNLGATTANVTVIAAT